MLSRIAKLLLVSTSFAPICLTLAFVAYTEGQPSYVCLAWLAAAFFLALLCVAVLRVAARRLEIFEDFQFNNLKTADTEIVGFILAYLFPLIGQGIPKFDPLLVGFITVILAIVVSTSNSYHFNPLLGLFGFHFYEITTTEGITQVLISKRHLRNCNAINSIVHLTDYMVLDIGSFKNA